MVLALALAALLAEPINVNASELWDAFYNDPVKAQEKYLDKELLITGIVKSKNPEKGFLTFRSAGFGIHVEMKDKGDLKNFAEGKRYTVRCKCIANPKDKIMGVDFAGAVKEPD